MALSSDMRWTWRALPREPWPNAAVVVTLALGIAAVTTVFAVSIAFQKEGQPELAGAGVRPAENAFRSAALGSSPLVAWPGHAERHDAVAFLSEALWRRAFAGARDVLVRTIFDARIADGPRVRLDSEASAPSAAARSTVVSPGYFAAVGVPMLVGREFTAADADAGGVRPVILSESLARSLFGEAQAVGRRMPSGCRRRNVAVAALVPARRASRVDPVSVLRAE